MVDASVAVAAFAEWHPRHVDARSALGPRAGIVAHAAYETYSVLTRLPGPHRMSAGVAWSWLENEFSDRWLGSSTDALRLALGRLEELGVAGGSTYDGLIGITAAASGATLVTLDTRALPTYERVGVEVELVE